MKTAIELADEFPEQNPGNFEHDAALRLNDWGIEAHAMLRQQAEQLSVWLAANGPGGWIDDLRNKCEALEITNDALKADAERYRWWVTQVEHKDFENLEKAFKSMEAREDVTKQMMDAAIDAMKGKS